MNKFVIFLTRFDFEEFEHLKNALMERGLGTEISPDQINIKTFNKVFNSFGSTKSDALPNLAVANILKHLNLFKGE